MTIDRASGKTKALIVGLQTRICAVPLSRVIEIMRPLPVEKISGVPSFVLGVSIIRGIPTPVLDLGAALGAPAGSPDRFVTLRVDDRQIALSVGAVLGIHEIDMATIQELPPLLRGASQEILQTVGTLDEQVLVVLRAGWELPDEVWQAMTLQETAQ